ncbi:MAG: hypothetical protein FWE53_03155 [Firmicutes bacterium]|nr:hypothetical protein [Bacillota bacterium]
MMLKKLFLVSLVSIFICFQLTIYILLHTGILPMMAEYSAIAACFVFAIIFAAFFRFPGRSLYLIAAFLFVAVADLFLVIIYQTSGHNQLYSCIGISFFVLAQLGFMAFLHGNLKTRLFKIDAIIRSAITVFIICFAVLMNTLVLHLENLYLVIIVSVYLAQVILNIVFACIRMRQDVITLAMLVAGLVLLLLCDVFLGLGFLNEPFAFNWEWLFYLPAMTIVALCALQGLNQSTKNICK